MAHLDIRPFTQDEAQQVSHWRYSPPYDLYDSAADDAALYLEIAEDGTGYYALVDEDAVVGFCCFGAEARVRGQVEQVGTLDIGGGIRPDRLSEGIATAAFPAILAFGQAAFGPEQFRTAVATFNDRSLRLCLAAGFVVTRTFDGLDRQFYELTREAAAVRRTCPRLPGDP